MAKLNQIIAIEKGIKSRVYGAIGELDKAAQKPDLFNGLSREYRPVDSEDTEVLPPERKRVQHTVQEVLLGTERGLTELMDITARKDWTNCEAKSDVVVDGATIIKSAPVTFLLFMEKQLTDLRTQFGRLPILDEAEEWSKDEHSGLYRTAEIRQHRTKKKQKGVVLYDATPEHPAQTQLITEDIIAGFWHSTKQSGAMPKPERDALLNRIEKLLNAVKQAREAANSVDESASDLSIGAPVFDYLLGER